MYNNYKYNSSILCCDIQHCLIRSKGRPCYKDVFRRFFLIVLRLIFIIINSLCFPLDARYVYILTLKFFNSSIFKSSSNSISDTFKDIDMKIFPKSIKDGIYSVITIFRFISTILIFF